MQPDDLVHLGIGRDGALEVDVVALGNVGGVKAGAVPQSHFWRVCNALGLVGLSKRFDQS